MRLGAIIIGLGVCTFGGCGDSSKDHSETTNDIAADSVDVSDIAEAESSPDIASDSAPPDTEPADTEPADTEPADTGPTDTGPTDTEPADTAADTTDGSGDVTPSAMKHVLCHGPANALPETITVAEDELAAHVDHGDDLGPCSPLGATLVPESHTIIDCGGREMSPLDATVDTFVFLHDVEDVHLVDCVVHFEFGVFGLNARDSVITGNQIESRSTAILLLRSSDNLVEKNTIRYGANGVALGRDSDRNVVVGNELVQGLALEGAVATPGLPRPDQGGAGVSVYDDPSPESAVLFAVINGELVQAPSEEAMSDDDVIRDNDISAGTLIGVVAWPRSNRTLVQGNRITGGSDALACSGWGDDMDVSRPGTCSLAADRYCRDDADCDIAGVDSEPLGVCEGTSATDGEVRAYNSIFENNETHGAGGFGVWHAGTLNAIIRNNVLADGRLGIGLDQYSVEAITVTGNVVSGNEVGIQMWPPGFIYGATVTGNDFIDNALQIRSLEIRAKVNGNFWGRDTCPGFASADTEGPAADCAPYVVSVAGGVPEDATPCSPETLRQLDRYCAFEAPATVTSETGSSLSFEVAVGFSGAYTVTGHGLVAGVSTEGTALPDSGRTLLPIEVPAGTYHLRIAIDGDEAGKQHDLDLALFDASCDVFEWGECPILGGSASNGSIETIDLPLPADASYMLAIDAYYIDGDHDDYTLSWWFVGTENVDLTVTTPSTVVGGTTPTVQVAWPEALAPGSYLGVLDHANEYGPLGTTVLDVSIAPP